MCRTKITLNVIIAWNKARQIYETIVTSSSSNVCNMLLYCKTCCHLVKSVIRCGETDAMNITQRWNSFKRRSGSIPLQSKTLKRTIKQAIKWLTAAFYVWIYYNLMIHLERDNMPVPASDLVYYVLRAKRRIFSTFYDTIKTKFMKSIVKNQH